MLQVKSTILGTVIVGYAVFYYSTLALHLFNMAKTMVA